MWFVLPILRMMQKRQKKNSNIISLPLKIFKDEKFEEHIECKVSEGYGGEESTFKKSITKKKYKIK